MNEHKILFVRDEQPLCQTIGWALEYRGYQVRSAASPEAATEALVKKNYDLVIAKLTREDIGTLEVLKRARKLNPAVKVMVIGADQHMTFPPEAYQIEVDDYLLMPISPTELWRRVSRCLEKVMDLEIAADSPVDRRGAGLKEPVSNRVMLGLHDIRSSIVSTAASLKLLIRGAYGETNPQVKQKLQELYDKVKSLSDLAYEFMHEAHLANDRIEGEEALDLRQDVIEPVLEELTPEIRGQRITIKNRVDSFPDEMIPLNGNKSALKGVFRNLLNNAIKYGGSGCCIVISLEMQGSKCRLQVYNTGKPVPEEYRPLLFSRQLRRARKEKNDRDGLGLGLYLSRKIIKNQGGDMLYEAKVDGSNFVVSLPRN